MRLSFSRLDPFFQDVVYLVVVGRMEHKGDWLLVDWFDLSLPLHGFRRRLSRLRRDPHAACWILKDGCARGVLTMGDRSPVLVVGNPAAQ